MKNRFIFGIILLILLSTFISQKKISINNFKVQEIKLENNKIIKEQELMNDLSFLLNQNLVFLNSYEIKKKIKKQNFIKSLEIKKIYPNKLIIKIEEKEPIGILINKKDKFFLGKSFELITYTEIPRYKNLPTINGDNKNFKIFFNNLKKINFPLEIIESYYYFDTKRWDLEINNKKIIKLPSKNYIQSLKNFKEIRNKKIFEKYKIFDYRLGNQLILK